MKTRILTALAGIPFLVYVLLFSPLWFFGVSTGAVCAVAAYELMHMSLGKTPRRLYFSAMACAFAMPVFFSLGVEFSWGVGMLLLLFFILS